MSDVERDPELEALLPLDDQPGPAERISHERAQVIVRRAIDAGAPKQRRKLPAIAIAASLAFVAVGTAIASIWIAPPQKTVEIDAGTRSAIDAAVLAQQPEPPPAEPPPIAPEPPKRAPSKRAGEPDDLLQKANTLRGQKRWREAEANYRRVLEKSPRSPAAYVGAVAAAAIRLEHLADPRGALRLYRRAQKIEPKGALDAEITWGEAAAYRALDRPRDEANALERLLAKHPGSAFAASAKARLEAIARGER